MSFSDIAALTIHDVKNNLAQLAASAESRGDTASMQIALQAASDLTRLLCFYKSESDLLHLSIGSHDPREIIEDLLSSMPRTEQEQKIVQIHTDLTRAPTLWFYDKTLLQMALANALQNALRYAKSRIDISVIGHPNQLEICIQDDGDGYPDQVLHCLDESAPVSDSGTGLGLLLAKRIVEMHCNGGLKGSLFLSNQSHQEHRGSGAQLRILLP